MSERDIFLQALDIKDATERAAFLDGACAGQPALHAQVAQLLKAHELAGRFLDQPHPVAAAGDETRAYVPESSATETAGMLIAGKYKLLQRIGEGGMGSVWMADQLEPVKRRVAVKLVRAEREGSHAILSRFEAERQAIALMDHPNIAKLLDAGSTGVGGQGSGDSARQTTSSSLTPGPWPLTPADGRPFFVMELVKGVPLTDFCDEHRLSIPDRLQLFMQICGAVQHAHQKGIIHRDLKPTNILVEMHDDKPVPKVIDFGLAKAMSSQPLTEHTLFTAFGTVAGTPIYMAPEQAKFNAIDVDTRADIYALGVILYELLTGSTPIERATFKKAALDEILRLVRETDPPIPSRRLSTTQSKPTVAANRHTEPEKLGRFVKGELDWIVMKALAKERDRRYETANGFARDIERFLNNQPVQAGPPSASYRMRKFVQRNRGQVIAASLLLFALLAGIAGTTVGLIRAEQQRQLAEANEKKATEAAEAEKQAREQESEQRAKAEQARDRTRQALDAMTSTITGDSLTTQKEISADQKKFLTKVLKYYQEFAGEKADEETSRARTAAAAFRVGLIERRLGRKEEGIVAFQMARDGYAKLTTDFPAVPEYRLGLARSHHNLGFFLADLGKGSEAEEQYRQALAIQEKLVAEFPTVPEYRRRLANSHNNLGILLKHLGKRSEAEEEYRKALAIEEKLSGDLPGVPEHRHELAGIHINLGILLADLGKRSEAEEQFRKALAIEEKLAAEFPAVPPYRQWMARALQNLGSLLKDLGKRSEAEKQQRNALAIQEKLADEFPAVPEYRLDLAASHNHLGSLLDQIGKRSEAEEHYRKALTIQEKLVAEFPAEPAYQVELASHHHNLGVLLRQLGKRFEAKEHYRKALTIQEKLVADFPAEPNYQQYLASSHDSLGVLLRDLGKRSEAEEQSRIGLAIREKLAADFSNVPEHQVDLGGSFLNYGILVRDSGQAHSSLDWFEKAIRTLTRVYEHDRRSEQARQVLRNSYHHRARAYDQLQKYDEADKDWVRAIELSPKEEQMERRVARAISQLKAGRGAEALGEVAELTKSSNWNANDWYNFACVYAVASSKIPEKKKTYADRAMELLKKAIQAGYKDAANMKQDTDLDALRDRDDFKKLLAELTAGKETVKKP
jgi:serine/threonine protein kinase/Flp pilus assembly protein TadD